MLYASVDAHLLIHGIHKEISPPLTYSIFSPPANRDAVDVFDLHDTIM